MQWSVLVPLGPRLFSGLLGRTLREEAQERERGRERRGGERGRERERDIERGRLVKSTERKKNDTDRVGQRQT